MERNLAQTLQHSIPLQPRDPSICQGSSIGDFVLVTVVQVVRTVQRTVISSGLLYLQVYFDSNYWEAQATTTIIMPIDINSVPGIDT